MSTRAIIARRKGDSWEGNYHHWDGYPSGLGKSLWDMYHTGPYAGRLDDMAHVLIDEHLGGWSTIVDKDWTKEPGFQEYSADTPSVIEEPEAYAEWAEEHNQPQCYCHGDRSEGPYPLLGPNADAGAEWVYVLDVEEHTMSVYEAARADERHAVGMFGFNPGRAAWVLRGVVDLDGAEPDWGRLDAGLGT